MRATTMRWITGAVLIVSCATEDSGPTRAVPVVSAVVDLTIGLEDGGDPYVFGRISGLAAHDDRVFAADRQADEIRAYDQSGHFLFHVARRGAGPGELSRPCCLAVDPAGLLWVRDAGNRRYSAYRVDEAGAQVARSVLMTHNSFLPVPPTFASSSLLIDVSRVFGETGPGPIIRDYLDPAGESVREEVVPKPPNDSVPVHLLRRTMRNGAIAIFSQEQPFGPRHLVAHGPRGQLATAVSSHDRIRWQDQSGRDTVVIGDAVGPDVTSHERDSVQERLGEILDGLPFGIADQKPPLAALQFDGTGRLWAHLTAAHAASPRARVHALDGEALMTVQWPAGIDLLSGFLDETVAFGIHTDSLGVQRVVRLTWSPPEP